MPLSRSFGALLTLGLLACAPAAPPPVAPPILASPGACIDAPRGRAAARATLAAGELWRGARDLGELDARCPESAAETATLRAEALIELGAFAEAQRALSMAPPAEARRIEAGLPEAELRFRALDPDALVESGFVAASAGRAADARRLFDRALARAALDGGEPLHVDVRDGIRGEPRALAWTPEDRIVVAHDDFITIVDVPAAREVARWRVPGLRVNAISPDGKWLLRIEEPRQLYDIVHRAPAPALEDPRDPPEPVFLAGAFSPDSRLVAMGYTATSSDYRRADGVLVWEVATGRLVHHLAKGTDGESAILFSPNGALIAAGNGVGDVSVWELASEKRLLDVRAWTVKELHRYRPDATLMMDRRIDGLAFLLGEAAIGAVWEGELHVTPIPRQSGSAELRRADGLLVASGADNRNPIFELATRKRVDEPWLMTSSWLARLVPSPRDGRFAVAADEELLVAEHGGEPRELVRRLRFDGPSALAFSDDGQEIRIEKVYRPGRAWPSGRELAKVRIDNWGAFWGGEERSWKAKLGLVLSGANLVREATGDVVSSCPPSNIPAVAASTDRRLLAVSCDKETRIYAAGSPSKLLATIRELEGPPDDRERHGSTVALVTATDGPFEIFGDPTSFGHQLRCSVGARSFPLEVCAERLLAPGLLRSILRGGG